MAINWGPGFSPKGANQKKGFRQQMEESRMQIDADNQSVELYKRIEPMLREALFKACSDKAPITVLTPFQIIDDAAPNEKDDGDGFYKSVSSGPGRFRSVARTIEAGTILTFQAFETTTSSMIFKSATGQEYQIYATPYISSPSPHNAMGVVRNEGYFGIMGCTSIMHDVLERIKTENGDG